MTKKKRTAIIIAAAVLTAVIALLALFFGAMYMFSYPERHVTDIFLKNRDRYVADALSVIDGGESEMSGEYRAGAFPIVEYEITGSGFGPSTSYYGVYYSPDDMPLSFQNAGEDMEGTGIDTWEWHGTGDNRGRVKRIEKCWFYFEARF